MSNSFCPSITSHPLLQTTLDLKAIQTTRIIVPKTTITMGIAVITIALVAGIITNSGATTIMVPRPHHRLPNTPTHRPLMQVIARPIHHSPIHMGPLPHRDIMARVILPHRDIMARVTRALGLPATSATRWDTLLNIAGSISHVAIVACGDITRVSAALRGTMCLFVRAVANLAMALPPVDVGRVPLLLTVSRLLHSPNRLLTITLIIVRANHTTRETKGARCCFFQRAVFSGYDSRTPHRL
jgi:hypothetical protein